MYKYDQYDQAMVDTRVEEFRDQTRRRIDGTLAEENFRPLRLQNGLYLQLHAYMLRVAVPYGTLSSAQMRMLGDIADKYDRGYGHFTTRQNIQYNWIKLAEAPDILADLASVEMHAIQTSGESIRNISSDHYAGAAADEVIDPRPWSEMLRQMTTFMPEFSYLPRKFKIAVIASAEDRVALRWHDFALRIVQNAAGELGFEVFAGGGMGRTPFIAYRIRDFLPTTQIFSYLQAVLRVWNRHARRDNIHKQRMKILVHDLGQEEFTAQVEEAFAHFLSLGEDFPQAEYDRIAAYFEPPAFEQGLSDEVDLSDPAFAQWVERQVVAHKAPGYAIANISLKPVGGIPGDITAEQMELVADLAVAHAASDQIEDAALALGQQSERIGLPVPELLDQRTLRERVQPRLAARNRPQCGEKVRLRDFLENVSLRARRDDLAHLPVFGIARERNHLHVRRRCANDADGVGRRRQVASHQRQVRRLDGHVGAGAHGEAEVGLGQGGGVVHAVADHGDDLALALQPAHHVDLVLGQHLGDDVVDADLAGHGPCRPLVVAGEEHRGEAEAAERPHRLGRGGLPGLCLLVSRAEAGSPARERLDAVASTTDGFELSRVDLEQRREGDVLGRSQSGFRSSLQTLRVLRDEKTIVAARAV